MKMYPSLIQRLLSLFIVSGSLLFAQQEIRKKKKGLLSSSIEALVAGSRSIVHPEESLSRIQVAPVSEWNWLLMNR